MLSLMRALVVWLGVLCGPAADAQVLHFTVTGDCLAQSVIAYQETDGQAAVFSIKLDNGWTWTDVSKKVGKQDQHMSPTH